MSCSTEDPLCFIYVLICSVNRWRSLTIGEEQSDLNHCVLYEIAAMLFSFIYVHVLAFVDTNLSPYCITSVAMQCIFRSGDV